MRKAFFGLLVFSALCSCGGASNGQLKARLALSLFACGGASDDTLRTRAAFDMKCEGPQLRVIEIDDRTRGVIGCGQRHTYVESCKVYGQTAGKSGCTWVLNGSSDR